MRRSALMAVAAVMAIAVPYPLLWPEPQAPAPTPIEEFTAAEQRANNPAADEAAIAPDKDQSRVEATTAKASTAAATRPEANCLPLEDCALDPMQPKRCFTYLADYAYSEVPPDEKPADTVLNYLISLPIGTPLEEIREKRGLRPRFRLHEDRCQIEIDSVRHSAPDPISAYSSSATMSSTNTDPATLPIRAITPLRPPTSLQPRPHSSNWRRTGNQASMTFTDSSTRTQGAEEHVGHPERTAWKSMCATDEGREKGEKWCKRAIWANTLPAVKHIWKSVRI